MISDREYITCTCNKRAQETNKILNATFLFPFSSSKDFPSLKIEKKLIYINTKKAFNILLFLNLEILRLYFQVSNSKIMNEAIDFNF